MGKILEYNNLGAPPADTDLVFMGDYSEDASNPTTKRLTIGDLNKKRNVDAADANGLVLRDDSSTYGIKIHDGGNVGVGPGAATTPGAFLSVRGAADSNLALANFLNPSATTDGKYQQIIFGTDAANDKSVVFRYYYSTTDNASTLRIQSYEDAVAENEIGLHLKGDGNVGIGDTSPSHKLDVKGAIAANGTFPVVLDPSTGEIRSTAPHALNINRDAGQNVTFMYFNTDGSTVNPALRIQASNKRVSIGNEVSPQAKLDIKESDGADTPVLRLRNNASGTPFTAIQFLTGSNSEYLIWDGSSLAIKNTIGAIGAGSVNFGPTGKIAINQAIGTRNLEVTETAGNGIVASLNSTSSGNGSKILFVNTVDSTSVDQSQGLGFTSNLGSTQTVSWFGGVYRPSGANSTNYFALHYIGSAVSGNDNQYAINTTLTENEMYLDSSGNVTFKGNVAGAAFYDKGGTTAGNYCRGRFIQTFSFPYYFETETQRWSPLLAAPYDTTNNYHTSNPPDKQFASLAPMGGRITRIDVSLYMGTVSNVVKAYIFTGASMPSSNVLTTSDSAYKDNIDVSSANSNSFTLGFDDFSAGANTGGQANLDFSQGDFLMLAMDTNTGNGKSNVTVTVEFDVPTSLGA